MLTPLVYQEKTRLPWVRKPHIMIEVLPIIQATTELLFTQILKNLKVIKMNTPKNIHMAKKRAAATSS